MFALALVVAVSVAVVPASEAEGALVVIGHRGAPHELPESTLAGFALALTMADAVELDVRASADGVLVVHHDATIPARCAPHAGERVRALTFAALREVACPPAPGQRPLPGAQIPSLDEVLVLARDAPAPRFASASALLLERSHRRRVLVEIKADDAPAPAVLARLLVGSLHRARTRGLVIVESFAPAYVEAVRAHAPEVARALLCGDRAACSRALVDAKRLGAIIVSPAHDAIDRAFVTDAHARGLGVVAWTANDPRAWTRLRSLRVDGIVTDDPRGLRASLGAP